MDSKDKKVYYIFSDIKRMQPRSWIDETLLQALEFDWCYPELCVLNRYGEVQLSQTRLGDD